MTAAYAWDFKSLFLLAFVLVVAMILGYRLMHRDPRVWRTRYGFFIERDRDRYDGEDEAAPDTHHIDPENEDTKIDWPKREEGP